MAARTPTRLYSSERRLEVDRQLSRAELGAGRRTGAPHKSCTRGGPWHFDAIDASLHRYARAANRDSHFPRAAGTVTFRELPTGTVTFLFADNERNGLCVCPHRPRARLLGRAAVTLEHSARPTCRGMRELRRGRHPSKQQRIPARTDQSNGLVDASRNRHRQ
jgi:hypothetical protein